VPDVANAAWAQCVEPNLVTNGAPQLDVILVCTFEQTVRHKEQGVRRATTVVTIEDLSRVQRQHL
jgi:hypothetical protein